MIELSSVTCSRRVNSNVYDVGTSYKTQFVDNGHASGVERVAYSEFEVDLRAVKGSLNLEIDAYCLFDDQNNFC